ncbi:MAG: site-2 protease family protein [Patescibacteria group bacterium]|nr:site-2 protease family protein [Patescibacteria group bacterium]
MNIEIITIIFWLTALFVSITVHEFMHAWTANYLGDPTAKALGRVSLNPIAHIDPIGTVLLPLVMVLTTGFVFGWAKPVQINPNNFRNYRVGQALTAIAGPFANLVMILLFTAIYKLMPESGLFSIFLIILIELNVVLMVFNLIPVPPLDGSKVLYMFLPFETIRKLEMYGPFILLPLLIFFGGAIIFPVISFILGSLGLPPIF